MTNKLNPLDQQETDLSKQETLKEKNPVIKGSRARIAWMALALLSWMISESQAQEKIEPTPQTLPWEKKQILWVYEEFDIKYSEKLKQLGWKDTPAWKAFYEEKTTQILNEKLDILMKQLPEKMQIPMASWVNKFPINARIRYMEINIEIINKLWINVATEIYRDLYLLVNNFIMSINTDINDEYLSKVNKKIEEILNKLYSKYPELKDIKSLYDFSKLVRQDQNERIIKNSMSSWKK